MQISNILESTFVMKSIGTRFLTNVLKPFKKLAACASSGPKPDKTLPVEYCKMTVEIGLSLANLGFGFNVTTVFNSIVGQQRKLSMTVRFLCFSFSERKAISFGSRHDK